MGCKVLLALFALTISCLATELNCPEGCRCLTSRYHGNHARCTVWNPYAMVFPRDLHHLSINNFPGTISLSDSLLVDMGLEKLETLRIVNTTLNHVPVNAFHGLKHLKDVDLSNNRIRELNPDIFLHNKNLKRVVLSQNPIKLNNYSEHYSLYFLHSDSIEELLLSNCGLSEIPPRVFSTLRNLEYLDLSKNNLTELTSDTLASLANLEEVNLAHNSISKIDRDAFLDVEDMTTLILRGNPIKTMEGIDIPGLKELDLSQCHFEILLADTFDGFTELSHLNLSGNFIQDINVDAFTGLPFLKYLDLSHNLIRGPLNNFLFEFNKQLETLSFAGNIELKEFSGFEKQFPYLYRLDISDCGIRELSQKSFKNMHYLATLNASGNALKHIEPKTFSFLTHLSVLDLSRNKIDGLNSKIFFYNVHLHKLFISENHITHLPAIIFKPTPMLHWLDLSGNFISNLWNISESFVMKNKNILGELKYLNVSRNKLTTLHMHSFISLRSLTILDISQNPIACTPDFSHIIQWLIQRQVMPDKKISHHLKELGLIDNNVQWEGVLNSICPIDIVKPTIVKTTRPKIIIKDVLTSNNWNNVEEITPIWTNPNSDDIDEPFELIQPLEDSESALIWPMAVLWLGVLIVFLLLINFIVILICKSRRIYSPTFSGSLHGQFPIRRGGRTHYQKLYEECSIPTPIHGAKNSRITAIFGGIPSMKTNSYV